MPETHQCFDCGLLAMRAKQNTVNYTTGDIIEVDFSIRDRFRAANESFAPICIQMRRDFAALFEEKGGPSDRNSVMYSILGEEHDCPDFIQHRIGATPTEHREMLDRRWMIDREDRRDSEMRAREDRRDAEAKNHHRDELIVFGMVLGSLTILAAFIERGTDIWPF